MKTPHYDYIDALRGYAILAVIVTHAFPMNSGLEGALRKIVDQGARGVELFFLISALTLTMSWHARHENMLKFYVRRFFRIAPIFWLGIIYYSYPNYWSTDHIEWSPILLTALFLNGWNPTYFNSVVPGGWSIVVEMNFYLLFPFFVARMRNFMAAMFLVTVSLSIAYLSFTLIAVLQNEVWPPERYTAADVWMLINHWLPNELPIFLSGIALYYLVKRSEKLNVQLYNIVIFLSLVMMIYLAIRPNPWVILRGYVSIYFAYGILFCMVTISMARGAGGFLVNKLAVKLGKVSFSAYLLHFEVIKYVTPLRLEVENFLSNEQEMIIKLIYFGFVVICTYLLSCITYGLIERPAASLCNILLSKKKTNVDDHG